MIDAIYIGATGMQAQQLNVDTIANNLANVNTVGYKKNSIGFEDIYYEALINRSTLAEQVTNNNLYIGLGARVNSNKKIFTQGNLKATGSNMDVAIQGNGLFELILPDGTAAYTRQGTFKVDGDGMLATISGHPFKQQIRVPSDVVEIVVDGKGLVSGRVPNENELIELGQLELANFPNVSDLSPIGQNLYVATENTGDPEIGLPGEIGLGTLLQGSIETSNVELSEELVNLVLAQRAYELNAKVIQTTDEMLAISNNLRR